MNEPENRYREIFIEEAKELLASLEAAVLGLEESPEEMEYVGRALRALHTIKGSGYMCGFNSLADFAHELEAVFELARDGEMAVSGELVGLFFASLDRMKKAVEEDSGQVKADPGMEKITSRLRGLLKGCRPVLQKGQRGASHDGPPEKGIYRLRFAPPPDIFDRGMNPLLLLNELRRLGDCTVTAHAEGIPALKDFDPFRCYTYWDIFLYTDSGPDAIKDVFLFVDDEGVLSIERLAEPDVPGAPGAPGDGPGATADAAAGPGPDTEGHIGEAGDIPAAKTTAARPPAAEWASDIKVATGKLDRLVNLVGELVTAQARLSQLASMDGGSALAGLSEEIGGLTEELRGTAMSMRMVPIGSIFYKFRRHVRDLSERLGKKVAFVTFGAETELDKTVIERIGDPLLHLIRNCIDHGIEPPDDRRARGKAEGGVISLSAIHSGPYVLVEVKDDGAGLDPERIREKAVERGLIAEGAKPSEREILSLVFEQGFSTAGSVTDISGRGVGLDAVKRSIEALRGSVEMESRPGEGTKVTLRLPLTLAIIDGLLVRVGGDHFVIHLSSVEECVEISGGRGGGMNGRRIITVRDTMVPYIRLREHFGVSGKQPSREQVVITKINDSLVGLAVDAVVGEYQTVVKSLGRCFDDAGIISGATVLGDGSVALILDAAKLVRSEERKQVAA